jgi:hypothetical protein
MQVAPVPLPPGTGRGGKNLLTIDSKVFEDEIKESNLPFFRYDIIDIVFFSMPFVLRKTLEQ